MLVYLSDVDGDIPMLRQPVDWIAGEGRFHPNRDGGWKLGGHVNGDVFHDQMSEKAPPKFLVGVVLVKNRVNKSSNGTPRDK